MKVYEFGMGFPPRAFGVYKDPVTKKFVFVWGSGKKNATAALDETVGGKKREEEFPATLYSFNWLPLGGFCKIKGENGEEAAESDSFAAQKVWKRLVVLVAGVTMNFLLAAVLLSVGFMIGLPTDVSMGVDDKAIVVQDAQVQAQQVAADSPAEKAGMQFGDVILSINGQEMKSSQAVIDFVMYHGNETLAVEVQRGTEHKSFNIKPEILRNGDSQPRMGVVLADAGMIRYPWYWAIVKGFMAASFGLINIFIAFFVLIKELILGRGLAFDISGPVGIAVVVGQSAKLGFQYLLNVTAMISLSLAAMNILPIPALDGGRALFVILEKIMKKPVSMRYEQMAHTIGFVLLMVLIVVITGRDVLNLF